MFEHIDTYAGDPILTLNETFMKDERPDKVNLSIGVYLNEEGKLPLMRAVRQAEIFIAAQADNRPYFPMEGSLHYRNSAANLIFGKDHRVLQQGLLANVQTVGGSGALKVGADFLARYFPKSSVWIGRPTWDNHYAIFAGAGMRINEFPYYDANTRSVDFSSMLNAIKRIPEGDIVLLHACCHNPTGADMSVEQWHELANLIRERALLPFFDMAYQGFGQGINDDAYAPRHFAEQGIPFLLANSFSKNFSLYGERCGLLSVLCSDRAQTERVLGQLKFTVRRNYSSPPAHGARIISTVLQSDELYESWISELDEMRARVQMMRRDLHGALSTSMPELRFDYLLKQTGMFSFTGLSSSDVDRLRTEFAVYLVGSGRICLAALTKHTSAATVKAIAQLMAST